MAHSAEFFLGPKEGFFYRFRGVAAGFFPVLHSMGLQQFRTSHLLCIKREIQWLFTDYRLHVLVLWINQDKLELTIFIELGMAIVEHYRASYLLYGNVLGIQLQLFLMSFCDYSFTLVNMYREFSIKSGKIFMDNR